MSHIVLMGMMGCGKSTCGRLLAQALGRDFADTDALVEEKAGKPIPAIFAQDGEKIFRDWELTVCKALSARAEKPLVIACGGGLPLREGCMALLKEKGTVLFLDRDPEDIYDHVNMTDRPLGQQGREAFLARYAQREPVYRRWADVTVKSQASPAETVALILKELEGET